MRYLVDHGGTLFFFCNHLINKLLLFSDVIHTVGPRGEKPDLLKKCYHNSLNLLVKEGLRSVVSSSNLK